MSDRKKEQISRLITEGENLNLQDLETFYRWIDDSYEALEFCSVHRRRFDDYCRSSSDSHSARIYVGVWMLRLALEEASPRSKDHKNYLPSCTNVPS
jgi:hypothetical protein